MDSSSSNPIIATLEKRLRPSWSSWAAAPSLSPAVLEAAAQGVDGLDRITKIRLMLALLGLDPSRRSACAPSLRRLVQRCARSTEEWVPIVASIVGIQLFPEDAALMHPHGASGGELDAAVKRVVSKIQAAIDDAEQAPEGAKDGTHAAFSSAHGPFEDKYSTPGESTNRHFTYTKKSPDFLSREGTSGSGDRAAPDGGQGVRRAAPPSLLLGPGHRPPPPPPSASQPQGPGGLKSSQAASRAGSLLSSIRGPRQEERKGPIMIPIAQIKQLEASRAEAEKKKRSIGAADADPKKKAKLDISSASESGTSMDSKKEDAISGRGPREVVETVPQTDGAALIVAGPRTPPLPGDASAPLVVVAAPSTPEAAPPAPSTAYSNTMTTPAVQSANPQRASLGAAVLDLKALFADSPLLSAEARQTIERFFGENWTQYFPDANQVLKFSLKSEDKILEDGSRLRETLYLKLQCNNHSWSKTKRSSKIPAGGGNAGV